MSTKRTTITIPEPLYAEAERIMNDQHFTDFSGFIQHLIRAEKERRENRAFHLSEAAADAAPTVPAKGPVHYGKSSSKPEKKIA